MIVIRTTTAGLGFFLFFLSACGGASEPAGVAGGSGVSGSGVGGVESGACEPSFDGETIHLAVGGPIATGTEGSLCLRWTTPDDLDISGYLGTLGPAGHHALLLSRSAPTEPDGVAPCSEAEIMDTSELGSFQMLAAVSYESSGQSFDFPSMPLQVGLHVPAGSQLIFDAHFLNASAGEVDACATLDLNRGKPAELSLTFRPVLPKEQYALSIDPNSSLDVVYEEPAGALLRVVAASSHMHEGGTYFRMSIKETGQTLYETTNWSDPTPAILGANYIEIGETQTLKLECSFMNTTAQAINFPDQMCVGGMYIF